MEHHSNIVPWQLLAQRTGATFRWIPIDDDGRLVESAIDEVINERTKVVSFVHQSNALGTINPVQRIVARAKAVGALTDRRRRAGRAAPAAGRAGARRRLRRLHRAQALRPDRRRRALGPLRPARRAAAVPRRRRDDRDGRRWSGSTFAAPPHRFEAGTPMIAAGGRARRGRRLRDRPRHATTSARTRRQLTAYALDGLQTIPGLRIIGPATPVDRGATISFALEGRPPARRRPVARRAGHRGARRPPLRASGLRALRNTGDHARVVRRVHHAPTRSTRWSRRRAGAGDVQHEPAAWNRCTSRSSSITTSTRSTAACPMRSTPRCTTSTRPAVTR